MTYSEISVGIKTVFSTTFNDTKSQGREFATAVKSSDLSESYNWLGNFPTMKEWTGDRDVKELTKFNYQITNKKWEASNSIKEEDIKYGKLALHKPTIEQLAQVAKQFPDELVIDMLINGHLNDCYDGKKFFATDHSVDIKGTPTTYSNLFELDLTSSNLLAIRKDMMSIKNEGGKSIKIDPNILLVGPQSLSTVVDVIDKNSLANGESNPTYKMFNYFIMPDIPDKEYYLLDTTKILKPFILQIANDGEFEVSKDHEFLKGALLYGVKSFMNAGYGLWQLGAKSTGVTP